MRVRAGVGPGGVRTVAMDVVGWEPVKMHVRKQMLGKHAEADIRKIRGGRCEERRRKIRTQMWGIHFRKKTSITISHTIRAENSKNKIEWDEKMKAGMLCRRRRPPP